VGRLGVETGPRTAQDDKAAATSEPDVATVDAEPRVPATVGGTASTVTPETAGMTIAERRAAQKAAASKATASTDEDDASGRTDGSEH
jgi:preprotein translocase subunit SecD